MGGLQRGAKDSAIHGGALMPTWAAWITGIILCLLVGAIVGYGSGTTAERDKIANDCRQSGAFTVGRVGFNCEQKSKLPEVEY